ncbi:hypothetical protein T07_13429 [Trichinella nelsoni]|uniref:Uncharacterized protein n=1 Tax=Trichinella nelsoni TaxID=6336 RepID=A0A0V0SHG7_9BILA|nr:hypothetical protein T07_13429 [Trichinella nelsoni]
MVCKNRSTVLYARDAQIFLGQPNMGSQEDGRDQTTAREIDDYSNDTRYIELGAGGPGGWLARTANERLAHSGCYAFGPFDLAMVIWRARPSGGFFGYFMDPQLAQWRKQRLSGAQRSTVAAAGGLSDPGPAVRGYCCSSVRDRWASSARVGSSRRGR